MIDGVEEREMVASLVHELWIQWMQYFQKQVRWIEGMGWAIPEDIIVRWQRQMRTKYDDLPEEDKESNRRQADKILDLMAEIDLASTEPYGTGTVEHVLH